MEVEQAQLEEDEEQEEIDIVDEASLLSLSMKPDRNMALLDDYEMEELGHTPDTHHRSGLFVCSLPKPYSYFVTGKLKFGDYECYRIRGGAGDAQRWEKHALQPNDRSENIDCY